MAEQGHERWQAHTGVDQAGPERVPELVQGDPQRLAGRVGQARVGNALFEADAEAVLPDSTASLAEYEVGEVPVAWVRDRPVGSSMVDPVVKQGDGVGFEWDHAFGSELADGDLEPTAAGFEVDDATKFEVE